jgi:hypothetical protein
MQPVSRKKRLFYPRCRMYGDSKAFFGREAAAGREKKAF